ncbi:NAD(P)-dependent oxidoreductase [Gleimia hominis]|uniref:NAD(P)-dependent oxidoreductase n=1 Tax=Gleimia hominis TaxID=595468 RepID=A0ABU3I919_9ACTO|nr:NAD(P)-dependent oxidoreductase [Gleimia hominis]MDT3766877.1 NAD(P)-dependent oxidoreductase [Gleimia hominis]
MKIILPPEPKLDWDLPGDVEPVFLSENQEVPTEHQDAEAAVVWGMTPAVHPFVDQLPNVRYWQSMAAGPDGLMSSNLRADAVVCNGAHFHDRTVSEHALALTLALVRRVPKLMRDKQNHTWDTAMGQERDLHSDQWVHTVVDSKVVVWGFGAIGQAIGKRFAAFGSNVVGVAQSAGTRAGFQTYAVDSILEVLADADILVMVLPRAENTENALNQQVIDALPDRAVVVNVGRGSTVDESALADALKNGHLSGAGIDVAQTEPLPESSPLWDTPNLIISPHCAGGRPDGLVDVVAHNLKKIKEGNVAGMRNLMRTPQSK